MARFSGLFFYGYLDSRQDGLFLNLSVYLVCLDTNFKR